MHSVENCTFCEGLGIKTLIFCQSRCTKAKFLIKIVLVSSSCNDIVYHTIIGVVHASVHGLHFVGYNPFLRAIIYMYIYLLKHVCVYEYIQIQEWKVAVTLSWHFFQLNKHSWRGIQPSWISTAALSAD